MIFAKLAIYCYSAESSKATSMWEQKILRQRPNDLLPPMPEHTDACINSTLRQSQHQGSGYYAGWPEGGKGSRQGSESDRSSQNGRGGNRNPHAPNVNSPLNPAKAPAQSQAQQGGSNSGQRNTRGGRQNTMDLQHGLQNNGDIQCLSTGEDVQFSVDQDEECLPEYMEQDGHDYNDYQGPCEHVKCYESSDKVEKRAYCLLHDELAAFEDDLTNGVELGDALKALRCNPPNQDLFASLKMQKDAINQLITECDGYCENHARMDGLLIDEPICSIEEIRRLAFM